MADNETEDERSITTPDVILIVGMGLTLAVFIYGSFFMT